MGRVCRVDRVCRVGRVSRGNETYPLAPASCLSQRRGLPELHGAIRPPTFFVLTYWVSGQKSRRLKDRCAAVVSCFLRHMRPVYFVRKQNNVANLMVYIL